LTRALVIAVSLLLLAACGDGDAPEVSPGGRSSQRVTLQPIGSVDGAASGYFEYLPPGYGDGKPRPLLLVLHGAGENGDGSEGELELLFDGTDIPALIHADRWPEKRPFIVLAPQHEGGDVPGSLCPDSEEIASFIRFALEQYDVDRRRIYLTGLSCGAIGAWDYLADHTNEVVAAAVLIAGDGNNAVAEAHCALARVPIWAFHGDRDSVVSVFGSVRPISRLKEECTDPAPVDLRLTVYPGVDHDSWRATYDLSGGHDFYAWLLRHENPGAGASR
jgi:predicted peptidase